MTLTEKISLLYSLSIGPGPKAMIALVLLGKKPCVELDIFVRNTEPSKVGEVLNSIGLTAIPMSIDGTENPRLTAKFCVSHDPVLAEMLAMIVRTSTYFNTIPKNHPYHKIYGMLMGYPISAVAGFTSNNALSEKSAAYPESMKDNLLVVFNFSADCWASEVETIHEWEAALEKDAPEILHELQSCIAK